MREPDVFVPLIHFALCKPLNSAPTVSQRAYVAPSKRREDAWLDGSFAANTWGYFYSYKLETLDWSQNVDLERRKTFNWTITSRTTFTLWLLPFCRCRGCTGKRVKAWSTATRWVATCPRCFRPNSTQPTWARYDAGDCGLASLPLMWMCFERPTVARPHLLASSLLSYDPPELLQGILDKVAWRRLQAASGRHSLPVGQGVCRDPQRCKTLTGTHWKLFFETNIL